MITWQLLHVCLASRESHNKPPTVHLLLSPQNCFKRFLWKLKLILIKLLICHNKARAKLLDFSKDLIAKVMIVDVLMDNLMFLPHPLSCDDFNLGSQRNSSRVFSCSMNCPILWLMVCYCWPTSRWFVPWSVKWPPQFGAMTAPNVSASIKLFSNLLCTNFQITCQPRENPAQQLHTMDNIYGWCSNIWTEPCLSKEFQKLCPPHLLLILLFLYSCEKLVSKYFLQKHQVQIPKYLQFWYQFER